MKLLCSLIGLAVVGCANAASGSGYTYAAQDQWTGVCNDPQELSQSPINIESAVHDPSMPDLELYYIAEEACTFSNKAHTVQVDMKNPAMQTMKGGNTMSYQFKAAQVHFHWGVDDSTGSEHFYGGKQYPLEAHIVHVREDLLSDVTQAVGTDTHWKYPGGLAVVGIQFELAADGEAGNPGLDVLVAKMSEIGNKAGGTTTVDFDLNHFLPDDYGKYFYAYQGGLTTPGCNQAVQWHNLAIPMKVSKSQLASFRSTSDGFGNAMAPNFRELQPMGGRVVKASHGDLVKRLELTKFIDQHC